MALKDDLDLFFNHFEKFRTSIIETNYNYSPEISQSVLLCSIIDTISNVAYPNLKLRNNEKFTYFVDDFSGWDNVDRVSLVQLYYYLENENDKKYEPIKKYTSDKVSNMESGSIYKRDIDEYFYELDYLKVIEEEIRKFTYSRLLYKYRNFVVHELRTPGKGFNFIDSDEIHYHGLGHFGDNINLRTWELVFPVNYINNLVKSAISNLRLYCEENEINPYDIIKSETLWLNKSEVKKKNPT